MTCLLITRCFLLSLLVCDWAGDPYHGQSSLSQTQASQMYCCDSIRSTIAAVDRFLGPFLLAAVLPSLSSFDFASDSWEYEAALQPLLSYSRNLLYLFMSLQR